MKFQIERVSNSNDEISKTPKSKCSFTYDNEDNTWKCSKCDLVWQFGDGNPKDNNMNYCPQCGRRISDVK